MSNFAIKLNEPFNDKVKQSIEEKGYEISYITKLKPDLIFVKKDNGNVEELLSIPQIESARLSKKYKLI